MTWQKNTLIMQKNFKKNTPGGIPRGDRCSIIVEENQLYRTRMIYRTRMTLMTQINTDKKIELNLLKKRR